MSEYENRILMAIKEGAVRPAQIVRKTCLSAEHVKQTLRTLRKQKYIIETQDGYQIVQKSC